MKKIYTKPEIHFEAFSMSTSIAGGCEATNVNGSRLLFEVRGNAFTTSCRYHIIIQGGDGEYNGICYHVPSEDLNLFNS